MYSSGALGSAGRASNRPVSVPLTNHLPTPISNTTIRMGDLLEQVKAEYDATLEKLSTTKSEQTSVERKLQAQIIEMAQIQQTLTALEANHRRIRQQYDDDLMRLRRQLDGQQTARILPPAKRQCTTALQSARLQPSRSKGVSPAPTSRRLNPLPSINSAREMATTGEQRTVPSSASGSPSSPKSPEIKTITSKTSTSESSSIPSLLKQSDRALSPPSTTTGPVISPLAGGTTTSGLSLSSAALQGSNTSPSIPRTISSRAKSSKPPRWNWVTPKRSSSTSVEAEPKHPQLHQTMDHESVVCCVRFSPDGTMLATGSHETVRVFDVQSGHQTMLAAHSKDTETTGTNGHTDASAASKQDAGYVRAVAFSPDGTKLVAGMPHYTVRMWDLSTQQEEGPVMMGHNAEVYALDCVHNVIASGSGDHTVRLWDARTGICKKVFGSKSSGPSDGVTSVALSHDGRYLAAGSLDKVVRIWDTESAQLLDRLEGHSDSVYTIAFSPDGKNLMSGSFDRNVFLWDVNAQGRTSTRPRMVFQGHRDLVLSVAYTPEGRWLMSGSKDRSVVFWDLRSARAMLTLTGYRNSVISIASSHTSPYFATGSGDCLATVWKHI